MRPRQLGARTRSGGFTVPRAHVFTASDGTRIPMVPPPICRFCSDPIAEEWGRYRQCGKCTNRLKALARAAEPRWNPAERVDWRTLRPYAFERAVAVGIYPRDTPGRGTLGARVLAFKADGTGAAPLVEAMVFTLKTRYDEGVFDGVVPHPPTPGKRFRPAMVLAVGVAKALGIPVVDALELDAAYASTRTTDLEGRFDRAKGLHRIKEGRRVEGKRVLMIDDVLTSCGNAHWSAEVLVEAGATSVGVAVLGRTVGAEHLERIGYGGPL